MVRPNRLIILDRRTKDYLQGLVSWEAIKTLSYKHKNIGFILSCPICRQNKKKISFLLNRLSKIMPYFANPLNNLPNRISSTYQFYVYAIPIGCPKDWMDWNMLFSYVSLDKKQGQPGMYSGCPCYFRYYHLQLTCYDCRGLLLSIIPEIPKFSSTL